jgi:putative membrane protein
VHLAHTTSWPLEEAAGTVLIVGAVVLGAVARVRLRGRRARRRLGFLVAGAVVTGVALVPPLSTAAGGSLTGHMVQHLLLMLVAAPLVVLGEPLGLVAQGVRGPRRRRWAAASRRVRRMATRRAFEVGATVAFVAVVSLWHLPAPYDLAVRNDLVHVVEHATMVGVALLFWAAVLAPRPLAVTPAAPIAMLAVVTVHGAAVGLALVFAPRPWYAPLGGRSPDAALADQQASGAIMWGAGGVITVVCAVVLFALWLHRSEPSPAHPHLVTETPLGPAMGAGMAPGAGRPTGGGSG